jgi:hypothetical protein
VFLEATFRMEYGSYIDIVFIKNYATSVDRRQDDYECIYGADTEESVHCLYFNEFCPL